MTDVLGIDLTPTLFGPTPSEIARVFALLRACPEGQGLLSIVDVLETLLELGRVARERGAPAKAIAVLSPLSAAIRDRVGTLDDPEREIGGLLDECTAELAACLDGATADVRRDAMAALFEIAVWDRTSGGYGVGEHAGELVVERTNAMERAEFAARTEEMLQAQASSHVRERLGQLVVRLRGGAETERGALLREVGGHPRRISRLLELHRPHDAARLMTEVEDWGELLHCAELFERHRYSEAAGAVVAKAVESRPTPGRASALTWLYEQAVRGGDCRAAARWADELFQEEPTLEHWELLRASAKGRRRMELRHQLLATGELQLLLEILLLENKAREALSKLQALQVRTTPRALAVIERIADGVAKDRPRDAARLYAEVAEARVASGEPEVAMGLVLRGHEALMDAGNTVLAARCVVDFCRRYAKNSEMVERIAAERTRLVEVRRASSPPRAPLEVGRN